MTETQTKALAVSAHELTKSYDDITALEPLTLDITEGEAVMLVGHNGSGKTTFLRMAAGLLASTKGYVDIFDATSGSIEARAACSYIPDNPVLYDDLSVWEHLEYIARLHETEDWEEHANELLLALGLDHRRNDLPSTFSRGLRQKTALAVGLIRPFDLLLIDEPFVGLDESGRLALLEILRQLHADDATLVVATHQTDFAQYATRGIGLRDGAVVYDGVPDLEQVRAALG